MSLVYITYHEENINDIEKPTSSEDNFKFPKYVSVHRKATQNIPMNHIDQQGKNIISTSGKCFHKTFGYAETPLDSPSKYLKKNGGIKWQRLNDHICPPSKCLPPIPKNQAKREKRVSNEVNFIHKNIQRAKTATPHGMQAKYVDTVVGERHNLDGTGLIPEHVLSKKFGKPPSYLKNIKRTLEENMSHTNSEQEERSQEGVNVLSESDRNAILLGLRDNYSEVEKAYHLLPVFTDTHSKKQRKAKLEQELKRLEQDILLLEFNPIILVCEN